MTPQPVYDGALIVAASSVAITDIRGIERRLVMAGFRITPGLVIDVLVQAKRLRERGRG